MAFCQHAEHLKVLQPDMKGRFRKNVPYPQLCVRQLIGSFIDPQHVQKDQRLIQ